MGIIFATYANNCLVHSGDGCSTGVSGVLANTLATLHGFPDRRYVAEDVIWSEDSPGVFLSSHRTLAASVNLGESIYGPATGKRSISEPSRTAPVPKPIFEEWLVRDSLWLLEQLGIDADALARKMAAGQPAKKPSDGMNAWKDRLPPNPMWQRMIPRAKNCWNYSMRSIIGK